MGTISPTTVSDGETIDASDLNNPINTIANEINGNLDNDNIASSAAITPDKLAGGNANMLGAWQSWAPTWTDLTIGNGTEEHFYNQIGKTVFIRGHLTAGSTTTATLSMSITLPTNPHADYEDVVQTPIGSVYYKDAGATNPHVGLVEINSGVSNQLVFKLFADSGSYEGVTSTDMDATAIPFQIATGDYISYTATYEAA